MKVKSKEFPGKVDVKFEREESRVISRFWLRNWKDGLASNQDEIDCDEETTGGSGLERRARSMWMT